MSKSSSQQEAGWKSRWLCVTWLFAIASLVGGVSSSSHAAETDFASFIELPWRYVLGGHGKTGWLKSEQAGKRMNSLRTYKLYTLQGEIGTMTSSKAAPEADVCPDVWLAECKPEPDLEKPCIAVHAPWNPAPRLAKSADTKQEVYVRAVRDLLMSRGFAKPEVKITQHLRVDLDGDGEEEVLLSATRYGPIDEGEGARAGDYSFVLLRRTVEGKAQTQIINGELYAKGDSSSAPSRYQVSGLLDLDGDGKLEVIVHSSYYEGGATSVWQLRKGKLVKVLEVFCGA